MGQCSGCGATAHVPAGTGGKSPLIVKAYPVHPLLLVLSSLVVAPAQAPTPVDDTLIFQTQNGWSPRVNVEAGTVMVYGITEDLPGRIDSWKEHGYRVTVMTGVAWGTYGDYLRGDFDGKEHWNETQQESGGKLILHGGREVPCIAPSD